MAFAAEKSSKTGKTTAKKAVHRKSKSKKQETTARSSKAKSTKSTSSRKRVSKRSTRHTASRKRVVQQQPTPERYQEIQQALADRGYFGGAVDGTWGPDSVTALKRFQHDQNLNEDGKIGSLSLIALGLGPKREASAAPKSPGVKTPGSKPGLSPSIDPNPDSGPSPSSNPGLSPNPGLNNDKTASDTATPEP